MNTPDPTKPLLNIPENGYENNAQLGHLGALIIHVSYTTGEYFSKTSMEGSTLDAACGQLISQSIHFAASIRENNRHGLLQASLALARPLWERSATAVYLQKHPSKIEQWFANSKKATPSFAELTADAGFLPEKQSPETRSLLHSFVHGGSETWMVSTNRGESNQRQFVAGPMEYAEDICDFTCFLTARALVAIDECTAKLAGNSNSKNHPRNAAAYFWQHYADTQQIDSN